MSWKFDNNRSIYLQLVEEIRRRIITGAYPPGSKLASVRELASEAEVNPNTMQKALAELEREEIVFSQRTSGRFVTENEEKIMEIKKESAQTAIQSFLSQMIQLGFQKEEIIAILQETEVQKTNG